MDNRINNSITTGILWKEMLLFCIPIMIGTLFQQLYNAVDVIVVGKFFSTTALACVGGSSGMMINLFVGFFVGMTSGVTVVIAKKFGARNYLSLKEALHTSIALSILGGIVFSLLGILFTPNMLKVLGTPIDLMEGSLLYLRIYFLGLTFTFLFNTGSAILRALGDSKRPLYYLMLCCIVNIVLDILLVVVFKLGIVGVAIVTSVAQACSAFLVLSTLKKLDIHYRLSWNQVCFHKFVLKEMIKIGLPAGVQSVMNSLSGMIMTSAVNSLGTIAVAGNTAYAKLDGIYWMVSNAFAVAIATFVAQNLGANKMKRVYQSIRVCLALDLFLSGCISLFFFTTSKYLLYLFTNDPSVVEQALLVMKAIAPYYALVPIYEVLSSALRGLDDVFIPMVINIIGLCGVRAFYVLMQSNPTSIYQIIISCPISWLFTALVTLGYYLIRIQRYKLD